MSKPPLPLNALLLVHRAVDLPHAVYRSFERGIHLRLNNGGDPFGMRPAVVGSSDGM
jgi:hypothetical protein